MKHSRNRKLPSRSALAAAVTAALYLGFAPAPWAAEPRGSTVAPNSPTDAQSSKTAKVRAPAEKCMGDLRSFDGQMQKDGYWLSESGSGYGYPMYGYAGERGMRPEGGKAAASTTEKADASIAKAGTDYRRARPGFEVRNLIMSANILARNGQQTACENLLSATRTIYKGYTEDLRNGKVPRADVTDWKRQQIAAAKPVTDSQSVFRSDQLIGIDVVSQDNKDLGSVNDIVLSPRTSKIAYLVIGRGGVFGIDEKYVPVPWKYFKSAADTNLLVLDTNKSVMDGAPQVDEGQFSPHGDFAQQSQKVDAYWTGEGSGSNEPQAMKQPQAMKGSQAMK